MKTMRVIGALVAALLTLAATWAQAQPFKLYITGSTGSIRVSEDGLTWSDFVTGYGSQRLRGITTDNNGNVLVINRDGGTGDQDRPIYAFTPQGTLITLNTADTRGFFNLMPLGYLNGYLYLNTGHTQDFYSSWNGTSFGNIPMARALSGTWQANDMVFASSGGTDYQFVNGTSGAQVQRRVVVGNGTLSNQLTITFTPASGSLPGNWSDLAFSPSGRIILLGQGTTAANGIWVSDPGVIESLSITVTQVVAFSATTETQQAGDPGPNARDMVLIGTNLFVASNSRCYRFSFDDVSGTFSYVTNAPHGFDNTGIHLAYYIVPEPTLMGAGLVLGMLALRKRG